VPYKSMLSGCVRTAGSTSENVDGRGARGSCTSCAGVGCAGDARKGLWNGSEPVESREPCVKFA